MAKKNRNRQRAETTTTEPGEVGPRQPCPCGSGKRYKACHGSAGGGDVFVARPFEGLASEGDVVAMRELVPAATAPLTLRDDVDAHGRTVTLCTLAPGAVPAVVRDSGEVLLGLQVQHAFGDPSRDLAAVLLAALESEPGAVGLTDPPGTCPRLQDLVVDAPLEITVHEGYGYWVEESDQSPEVADLLEQADDQAAPTARLASVESAYWTRMGSKEHLRWVMPEPEGALLDALARLHAAGTDSLIPEGRLVGMFRAHGLLTPVWDLPVGTGAEALEDPAADFKAALDAALAETTPLTSEQRAARSGLANRQVTIR